MISKKEVLENLDQIKNYIQEIVNVKESKKINITIKNRFTGDIIWESEKTTYKEAVEEAIKNNADLSKADLSDVDLSGMDLSGVNLREANLSWTNLRKADLSEANLSWTNLREADLSEANLSWTNLRKADLSEANLSWTNLSEANLSGCLYYMGDGNRNFEALCKAIKTIKHPDGKFEDLVK
jgi:uncharacterized protein YjbI with pentapeptide repeats